MPDRSQYWFAPVSARPIPEMPDRVTVGVVFGNGSVNHIEVDPKLRRLKGMLSEDHRRILELTLLSAAGEIHTLDSLEKLSGYLGVQFEIGEKRDLLQPYSKAVVRSIRRAYLDPLESRRSPDSGLLRESLLRLDEEIDPVLPVGRTDYRRKVTPIEVLYPFLAHNYPTEEIGPLRRIVVGENRHIILASVVVRESEKSQVDAIIERATRQAYFLRQLRDVIESRGKKEYRFVAVVQPMDLHATSATRNLVSYYRDRWLNSAIDVTLSPPTVADASEQLAPLLEWAAE